MLAVRTLRELHVDGGAAGPLVWSAASGLVRLGQRLYVVADDELGLAQFDASNDQPGRLTRLLGGTLPQQHTARKAAKADFEALVALPAFGACAHGALLALGSGSRQNRQRGALLPLSADGGPAGPVQAVDLAPLLAPLHAAIADLNIEGAFVQGGRLCLLQRGNSGSAINACITLSWPAVAAWLGAAGPVPLPLAIDHLELGAIDGVPLSFTDGAALPMTDRAAPGGWLFSAAAEDTVDSYADGARAGSVIGRVDGDGALVWQERLSLRCKVEGIAATVVAGAIELLLVTDADDRDQPALLLAATLPL